MKQSTYEELDKAILEWFSQIRAEGTSLRCIMCQKAEYFFKENLTQALVGLQGSSSTMAFGKLQYRVKSQVVTKKQLMSS